MNEIGRRELSTMRWKLWNGGSRTPLIPVRAAVVVSLVALALALAPAVVAGSSGDDPAQGAWSRAEAEYRSGGDSTGAAASAGEFDADPAQHAWSLAEAMLIAGLGGPDVTAGIPGIAADPVANAWSLAEAEFIFVNRGPAGMSGRVYRVPASLCSAC